MMTHCTKSIVITRRAFAASLLATGALGIGIGEVAAPLAQSQAHPVAVASKAPGRNPITTWPSLVNAELASLTPPITLMSRCPALGFVLAPAWGGGQVQLYGCGGPKPS